MLRQISTNTLAAALFLSFWFASTAGAQGVIGPAILRMEVIYPVGASPGGEFRRGDSNGSQTVDIADAVALFGCLFLGGSCPECEDAADADDNGAIGMSDGIYTLNYLFLNGAPPPPPQQGCGSDLSPDSLGCESSACGNGAPDGTVWTHPRIPEASIAEVVASVKAQGGVPTWIDGYWVSGEAYYAMIFEKTAPVATSVHVGLTDEALAVLIQSRKESGYRVRILDSLDCGKCQFYCVIFEQLAGPAQATYVHLPSSQHEARMEALEIQGYRPVGVSTVAVGHNLLFFDRFVTALWEEGYADAWKLVEARAPQAFLNETEEQFYLGREPTHLNVNVTTSIEISAVYGPRNSGQTVLRLDLNPDEYTAELRRLAGQGYKLRLVAGYTIGTNVRYAAYWAKKSHPVIGPPRVGG